MGTLRTRLLILAGVAVCALAAFVLLGSRGGDSGSSTSTTTGTGTPTEVAASTTSGKTFIASVPAGWGVTSKSAKGAIGYHLSSTGRPISGLGIGPAGTIGITVSESGTVALARGTLAGKPANSYSAAQLLPFLVGQPAEALSVVRTQPPTVTSLDGKPAGEESFVYDYQGRQILQADVVAKHAGRIFTVELDSEPALASRSEQALTRVVSSWRWR